VADLLVSKLRQFLQTAGNPLETEVFVKGWPKREGKYVLEASRMIVRSQENPRRRHVSPDTHATANLGKRSK